MDFSAVPFSSALERFGHLLPVDALVRVASVQPAVQKCAVTERYFWEVSVSEGDRDGEVRAKFANPLNVVSLKLPQTLHYKSEAILNDGPVHSKILHLHSAWALPVYAVLCDTLVCHFLHADLLPLMRIEFRTLIIEKSETAESVGVQLPEVIARLGPTAQFLKVVCDCAALRLSDLCLKRRQNLLPRCLMSLNSLEAALDFLRRNKDFLVDGGFCQTLIVLVPSSTNWQTVEQVKWFLYEFYYRFRGNVDCGCCGFSIDLADRSFTLVGRDEY